MKIKKFVGGGIAYLPTSGSGQAAATPAAASSDSADKFKQDIQKKLLELSNIEGLDSDVSTAIGQIEQYLTDPSISYSTEAMNEAYLNIVRISNKVKSSYYDYKESTKRLEQQDAWSEPAYDSRGNLWVYDGKKIKTTSNLKKAAEEGFVPITNAELISIRRNNPKMAFDGRPFDDVSNAVGMQTIVKWAEERIKEFKDTTINGYASKRDQKLVAGMEHITAMDSGDFAGTLTVGEDGIYKVNQTATVADSDPKGALAYLISAMPNNYRNALSAKAQVEGYDPDAMLLAMLSANVGRKLDVSYDQTASKAAGFSNANEDAQKLSDTDTYAMRIAQMKGDPERMLLSLKPTSPEDGITAVSVMGIRQGKLRDKELKPIIKQAPLSQLLREMGGTDATIVDNITFGDIVLKPGDTDSIIWDGMSELSTVYLPYTRDEHGIITPDWGLLRRFEEFKKEISGNTSRLGENELLRKHQIDPNMVKKDEETGNWIINPKSQYVKGFLTFSGIASQKNLEGLKQSSILSPMDDAQADHYRTLYGNIVQYGTDARSKSARKISDFSNKGRLYRGNIFIPIDSYYVAAHQSRNQNMPKFAFTDFSGVSQAIQLKNDMQDEEIRTSGQFR